MLIRKAVPDDLDTLAAIEAECFPLDQAAPRNAFEKRLRVFPDHFLLLCEDSGEVISFINGSVTDIPDLTDEMYSDSSIHSPEGKWQMVFGLNTRPRYRRKGYAAKLMNAFIALAREEGRLGLVLTCKQSLIHYYEKFGFVNEGITDKSVIGGVSWYQMRLSF